MTDDDARDTAEEQTGGDPACWLAQLCPECGAVLESRTDPCWRCGLRPGALHDPAVDSADAGGATASSNE